MNEFSHRDRVTLKIYWCGKQCCFVHMSTCWYMCSH